jgi:hypothetical protein
VPLGELLGVRVAAVDHDLVDEADEVEELPNAARLSMWPVSWSM